MSDKVSDMHISWHEHFMRMAELVATKSKDRSTKVGAVIVNNEHTVLSTGYNGFARSINDNIESRHDRPVKYFWTEHGERNAIYAAARNGIRLKGSIIYVTGGGFPCADCARAIIQAGIVTAVGTEGEFIGAGLWVDSCKVGAEMLVEAGVHLITLNNKYVNM